MTSDNSHPLSKLTDQYPTQTQHLGKEVSREILETCLKMALMALKWFLGRQERGRVLSVFSSFIFRMTVNTIERLTGSIAVADFDAVDDFYVGIFEENHPGVSIDQRFDKTVKQ